MKSPRRVSSRLSGCVAGAAGTNVSTRGAGPVSTHGEVTPGGVERGSGTEKVWSVQIVEYPTGDVGVLHK